MSIPEPLQSIEESAYRRAYSDGIIDLFAGMSLLWMGAVWIWLPDYGGLAGILPAVFVPVAIAARTQYVERRTGYVRWSETRRNQERRNVILMFGAGVALFFAGVIAFVVVDGSLIDDSVLDTIMPGLLAWLLALLCLGLAVLLAARRFLLYAIVLGVAGIATASQGANPGWPMLVAGGVVAATGLAMLVAFTRANPIPEDE